MSSLVHTIGRKVVIALFYAFRIFPINKKKIYVKNFNGHGYGDSPKYIIDYLINHYEGYDVVWSVNENYNFPKGIRKVITDSQLGLVRDIYEQTTAKIWIDNQRKYDFERKRKRQYYIQTWHGDIGVKKVQGDAWMSERYLSHSKWDSKMADLFVCGNDWMKERYREAFWYDGEITTCGLPRRDILYSEDVQKTFAIKNKIGVNENVKLLLYVPTYRNIDSRGGAADSLLHGFNWELVLNIMQQRFGGEWFGLMRLHPNISKRAKELVLPDNVINVTDYPDVNELLCISDCCISDYSSALFDFALTKKPGFVFAPDRDNYEMETGCYFSKDQLPFIVASNMGELKRIIEEYDESEYLKRHRIFYDETIHMHPEGHASEYLVNRIVELCK